MSDAVTLVDIPQLTKVGSGKVREIFDLGAGQLLIVTTDRLSAFDVVLNQAIPGKGQCLNQLTAFWLRNPVVSGIGIRHHLLAYQYEAFPPVVREFLDGRPRGERDGFIARSIVVSALRMVPVECVVRGFLVGSGWKDYRASGRVCGIELPTGLQKGDCLVQPIFTPASKAASGAHDQNISFDDMVVIVDAWLTGQGIDMSPLTLCQRLRDLSVRLYSRAYLHCQDRGIVPLDTKFEFGLDDENRIVLGDEVLTPDSSRFSERGSWQPGQDPPSMDKQYVRDFLTESGWNKQPPPPDLPDEVIAETARRYQEIYQRLTA